MVCTNPHQEDTVTNLMLPGSPRYQPKELVPILGYDNLFRAVAEVELAVMDTLGEQGVIPSEVYDLLTPELREKLLAITTTEVDKREREVTNHDIRAWVQLAQEILPEPLRPWVHVPLTSYDVLDTARALQFKDAFNKVIKPKTIDVLKIFAEMIRKHAEDVQIGRTHGQHALPITFGFYLATIASRLQNCYLGMSGNHNALSGKVSGAVGAYNAQVGLGICSGSEDSLQDFEQEALQRLGLEPGCISTQIVQPEGLGSFLFSCLQTSATLAQFGRDCRHLMRSEIGEISEAFEEGQVGSSTMAHKRNPINFENLEGMYVRSKNEFGKVLDTMISEHQRDLVGSSPARDYPIIVVNLVQQLNTLLREGKKDKRPFLSRISLNKEACKRNFEASAKLTMAEPLYLALQMYGYIGDAHELVNHTIVPRAQRDNKHLLEVAFLLEDNDPSLRIAIDKMPESMKEMLLTPEKYTGKAAARARTIADMIHDLIEEEELQPQGEQ